MIRIFYGDDRIRANQEIQKILGSDYEVIEGADITPADLPSIFLGASLLNPERKILIRDFTANKPVFKEITKYLASPHEIILFETKLDKRSTTYKELKDQLEIKEFKLPDNPNASVIFDIYRVAKKDGPRSLELLAKIKPTEDPIKFTGLLVSQAIKDFSYKQGSREKRVLKELSKLDIEMKTTKIDPWLLVESFLLRLSTI